jgi:myo-inositol-1(or 4)-monophosphatase
MAAVDQPRTIRSKGSIGDVVTDTDKASEAACVAAIQAAFPQHAILGEEGGVLGGDVADSDYLW